MTLNKGIEHGKEHRKPYYKSGRFDRSCRPHGGCPWCEGGRLHKQQVADEHTEIEIEEALEEPEE